MCRGVSELNLDVSLNVQRESRGLTLSGVLSPLTQRVNGWLRWIYFPAVGFWRSLKVAEGSRAELDQPAVSAVLIQWTTDQWHNVICSKWACNGVVSAPSGRGNKPIAQVVSRVRPSFLTVSSDDRPSVWLYDTWTTLRTCCCNKQQLRKKRSFVLLFSGNIVPKVRTCCGSQQMFYGMFCTQSFPPMSRRRKDA